MTANHHTPLPTGSVLDATSETFNTRFSDLDAAISGMEAGTEALTTLKFGTAAAATITSGAITRTATRMIIDTEGGAATDDLDTINGLADGQIVILRSTSSARVPTIRHNVGNICTDSGANVPLTDPKQTIMLVYDSTLAKAVQIGRGLALRTELSTTLQAVRQLVLPINTIIGSGDSRRLALMPSPEVAGLFRVRAAAATVQAVGIAGPTVANSPANANDADGSFITLPSTASSGNIAGMVSATFNLVQRRWNPTFFVRVKTPADITALRYWIGLISADVTNVDTLAGATEFAGFRFSTVAGEAGWLPVTKDATTQSAGTQIGTVQANTLYELRVRIDDSNGKVYFSVNGSTEQEKTTNLPQAATDLGFVVRVIPTTASIRQINFSRLHVEMK